MTTDQTPKKTHKNNEKTVACPVENCDKETLARGLHLHILRSSGNGHGEQNEIPNYIDLEEAKTVGTEEVSMDYPESREGEGVERLCPYCERPYRGKHGVMIHLGQMAGRKDHPEDGHKEIDPDDLPIVQTDEDENVIEIVNEPTIMPSTEQRQSQEGGEDLDEGEIKDYIENLREKGLDEEADRAEKMLLGN